MRLLTTLFMATAVFPPLVTRVSSPCRIPLFYQVTTLAQTTPSVPSQPDILQKVGIDQHIGSQLPLDLVFHDENNRQVRLANYFQNRPVILVLVYYECPMLCTMVLNDLLRTMRSLSETAGKDFDIVTVSFDPRDTPDLAARKKKTYLAQYNHPGAENGWHFLTGDQASITALTQAVGFHYTWDPKTQVFAHASGIMVTTPSGTLSRYFFGIDYAPNDLRLALAEASENKTGALTTAVLLYCFAYDPSTGKYSLLITRVLKIAGVATLILLGSFITLSLLRERRSSPPLPSGEASGNGDRPRAGWGEGELREPPTSEGHNEKSP